MLKTERIPWWVFFAFSAIETRKGALILITVCVLFTVGCIPDLNVYLSNSVGIPEDYQLVDDWSWLMMMVPMTLWYVAALWWSDKNGAWQQSADEASPSEA
ncbi:hypothetical protein EDC56_1678 [Sinobacterium caligoides]|uniref:Uncharacterized protein n=2 Tax=Sinobacterium caligoides TaxID=933926 RepID=A0A3N2DNL3_9GAMM|nr:hypothetical protein EDC56_1678 [Sinobacterium caligoides]